MTSWTGRGLWLACLLWTGAARAADPPAVPGARPPEEIPCRQDQALVRSFQEVRTLRAAFTDRREVDLLDEPLVSRGRLHYQRPDRLHYAVESPGRQEIVVAGSQVRVSQQDLGRSRSLDIQASEIARAVVSSLIQVLGGRLDRLEADYLCRSLRLADGWEVRLAPRGPPLDRAVRDIEARIAGDGSLREVRVRETTGDSSRMTLEDVQVNVPFSAEEEKAYFTP